MENRIFSALVGHVKPNRDIFEHLTEHTGISQSESLFIDDSARNIDGAISLGIRRCLFGGDVNQLWDYLNWLLSKA